MDENGMERKFDNIISNIIPQKKKKNVMIIYN